MLVDGFQIGEELRGRPDHARLLEHDACIIVQLRKIVGADTADRTVDAQLFSPPEQVAVAPIAFQPQTFRIGNRAADAKIARLALADLNGDGNVAVGIELVGFLERDAVEHFKPEQPLARLIDLLGRVLRAALQAGHVFGKFAIDLLGALDSRVAEAGNRAGSDGQCHVERRGLVVGHDLAVGDLRKRPALFLQCTHDQALGLEDRAGAGVAARDQAEVGTGKTRRIAFQDDVAKREFRTGRNVDDNRDRLRPLEFGIRRQVVNRLAGDGDIDDALVAGIGIKRRHQLLAVAARLGQQAERTGHGPVFVALQRRGRFQFLDEILVGIRRVDGDGVAHRVDNVGIVVLGRSPQLDAEQFEGGCRLYLR